MTRQLTVVCDWCGKEQPPHVPQIAGVWWLKLHAVHGNLSFGGVKEQADFDFCGPEHLAKWLAAHPSWFSPFPSALNPNK